MVLAFQKNNSVGIEKDKLDKRETGGAETIVVLHKSRREITKIELRQRQ